MSRATSTSEEFGLPVEVLDRRIEEKELSRVTKCIGKEYFSVGIELGLSSVKIEQIISDHPRSVAEQIFQMFISWRNKEGRGASVRKVLQVLYSPHIIDNVDREALEDIFLPANQ